MKKFFRLFFIGILCLSLISLFSLTINASASDSWPMFHYDLAHNGYSTNVAPSSNQTLWTFPTNNKVWSSPAVSNGIVYVGSFDHNLYAIDAESGKSVWNYTTGKIYSSPAVSDGIVYIGSNDHKIYAIGESQTGSGTPMNTYYLVAAVIAVIIVVAAAVLVLKKRR